MRIAAGGGVRGRALRRRGPANMLVRGFLRESGPRVMGETTDVVGNLAVVRGRIAAAARAAGRPPDSVALVAVPKTFGPERVRPALAAGQRVFGENRVQEALEKWPLLKEDAPDVELHMIGPLQTNKAQAAAALFDVIETVDRPRLAAALARIFDRGFPRRKCYVEINTGAEPQKSGVLPEAADAFVEACRREYDLPVAGLMCLPPHGADPAPHFDLLRRIAVRNELAELSMGMTADYETAIAHGATHVRVGTAIFGERAPRGG